MSTGRPYLAIPGPSVMPDPVLQAMHRPAPNIYSGEIVELAQSLVPDLLEVAQSDGQVAIYIGNGHAVWEAALANTIAPGDVVLVPTTGRFGHGWAEMATGLGAEVQILEHGMTEPIDPARVAEALSADTAHRIKAVLAVHTDTSSSVRSDIAALRAAMDGAGHPALLMADCIASLGCDQFETARWGVDVMVAASQKGLMTPPGLGFVFFSDRAAAVHDAMPRISRYWDWAPRAAPEEFYQYWCGTAPTHHLYGLRAALDMIKAEGIEAIWTRHARHARAIWAACDAWGADGALALNVADPAHRSHAVTALSLPGGAAARLRGWTEAEMGLTLGIGLGRNPAEDFFRIGHMGHLNGQMVMGLLGSIEAGLRSLDIPAGPGALDAAAAELADG